MHVSKWVHHAKLCPERSVKSNFSKLTNDYLIILRGTVFYVRRMVDLIKTAKLNAYIMHIFGKFGLLSIHVHAKRPKSMTTNVRSSMY